MYRPCWYLRRFNLPKHYKRTSNTDTWNVIIRCFFYVRQIFPLLLLYKWMCVCVCVSMCVCVTSVPNSRNRMAEGPLSFIYKVRLLVFYCCSLPHRKTSGVSFVLVVVVIILCRGVKILKKILLTEHTQIFMNNRTTKFPPFSFFTLTFILKVKLWYIIVFVCFVRS